MARLADFAREFVVEARRLKDVLGTVAGPVDGIRLVVAWFVLTAKFRFRILGDLELRVRWVRDGHTFSARVGDVSELRVLREVFVVDEYALPPKNPPTTIIDLGSNAGFSVLSFAARYPEARIVAVEPDPRTYDRLVRNTRHLDQVVPVRAAVTATDGDVSIYSGEESWSTAVLPGPGRDRSITVQSHSLARLIELTGLKTVGLLKMDIEGSELDVLGSPALTMVDLVVFEFHQEYSARPLSEVVADIAGFEMVACRGDVRTHPLVTLKRADLRAAG